MVFVNSMSDLFHPEIPDAFIVQVAEVMMKASWHTYQVLTKRADRLEKLLAGPLRFAATAHHIWWGVSVEDINHGVPRIGKLLKTPAAMKFLSIEPLLEDLGPVDLTGIDWVIVGGESGRGARPLAESWVLNLQETCQKLGIPFFFKQWGGVNKKKNGRALRGKTYDELPARNKSSIPARAARQGMMAELQQRLIKANELQNISY
jgi:protein gp37